MNIKKYQVLTNGPHIKAQQIVMKMVSADFKPVVKISDEAGKSMSIDKSYFTFIKEHIASVIV